MVLFVGPILLCTAFTLVAARPPLEATLQTFPSPSLDTEQRQEARKLQGKFLHITDLHPDPFYQLGSSLDAVCHSKTGDAGYYGAEKTECDSPFTLIDATFQWIKENIRDEIDFVVWTGDSARHDNDEDHPRNSKQVVDLNKYVVKQFEGVFAKRNGKHDSGSNNNFLVPIVPNFGNNDIVPHNIFEAGPNKWTREYLSVWKKFVPEEQKHSFARGGWFWVEVIPNKLAVFSLNTLYFFDSNGAVNGCDCDSEPGYEHMEWLRIQLQFIRKRGMKAIMSGHVPPTRTEGKNSWDETCWQKYTLWLRQYRDVVVGSLWGHVNLDFFMFQDEKELEYGLTTKVVDCKAKAQASSHLELRSVSVENSVHTTSKLTSVLEGLRKIWSDLPRDPEESGKAKPSARKKFYKAIGGEHGERFSLSYVSPSVVPNYFPSLRIFEYNITGLEQSYVAEQPIGNAPDQFDEDDDEDGNDDEDSGDGNDDEDEDDDVGSSKKKKKKHKKKKHHHKVSFKVPKPPSSTSPPGPAYSPQPFTFTTIYQYYANLTHIHNNASLSVTSKEKTLRGMKPFEYQLEYDTRTDGIYSLPDLTVRNWIDLAERIGREEYVKPLDDDIRNNDEDDNFTAEKKKKKKKKKKHHDGLGKASKNHLWRTFVERAFVKTKGDDELEELLES